MDVNLMSEMDAQIAEGVTQAVCEALNSALEKCDQPAQVASTIARSVFISIMVSLARHPEAFAGVKNSIRATGKSLIAWSHAATFDEFKQSIDSEVDRARFEVVQAPVKG